MADVSENYYDSDRDGSLNGSPLCVETTCYSDMDIVASPFAYPGPENLLVAPEAVEHVLEGAGTSYPRRDAIDARLVDEVRSYGKEGQLISDEKAAPMNGPGYIAGGTPPTDSDGDGIPDEWESANGLDPNDPSDAMEIASSGYANIEVYLNSLV